MSIPGAASPLFLATTGAAAAFEISRSLRFNSGDSAYLNRTPSSAGNRTTWTWSGWVKQSSLATGRQCLFGAYGAGNDTDFLDIGFDGNSIFATANSANTTSTSKFRDPSAWFHYFVRYDGSNVKWYINGVEAHSWSRTGNLAINGAWAHQIGRSPGAGGRHFDGYLAEVNFIDGQALAPTDFGEFDDNGVWQAKEFTGVYSTADTTDNVYAWKATTSNGGNSGGWYFTQENNSSSIGLSGNTGGHPNELGSNTLGARTGQSVIGAYGTFATANSVSAGSSAITRDASFDTGTSTRSFVYNKTVNKVWVHNGSSWVGGGDPSNTSSTPTFSVPSSGKLSFGVSQNGTNEILTLAAIDSSVYSGTATGITFRGSYLNTTLSSGNTVATCSSGSGGYSDGWSIELLNNGTGENSYRLSFADNSGATATTLGKDTSGNSNNFTPNNLSVTAGSGNDSLVDTPTNGTQTDTGAGGEVVGNYATFNPLRDNRSGYTEAPTNGNLETNPRGDFVSTIPVTSGKYYWEITVETQGDPGQSYIGIVDQDQISTGGSRGWATSQIAAIRNGGSFYGDGSTGTAVTFAAGDVLGFALDADNNKLWISKNGTYVNSGNPAGGTGHAFSGLSFSGYLFIASDSRTGNKYILNAGQRAYNTAAPTGFKTWCTTNLPTPTIADGSLYFDTKLYTSTGADLAVTGLQFSPDFAWVKNRATANRHAQFDIVRGPNKYISSTRTNAEATTSGSGYGTGTFNSFDTNGFTVGSDVGVNVTNYPSGDAHVAWAWDGGTSTVSNTDGSITSNVRANPTAGFSIVSYSGNNSTSGSVGHGLNASPGMVIIKQRNGTKDWKVAHSALAATHMVTLNETYATGAGSWNGVTSSVFYPARSGDTYLNTSGNNYIAYCFAPVAGYSAIGSYEGNGNASGPFIYTGFKVAWLLLKNADVASSGYDWHMNDAIRDPYNTSSKYLNANKSDAEATYAAIDFLSNGFKLRQTGASYNGNGNTHVYIAFASNPFQANGGLAR